MLASTTGLSLFSSARTEMNSFDSSIISFLNGFAHHFQSFDTFVIMLSKNDLLKGGAVVALVWWAWFRPSINRNDNRHYLLCGIIACVLSVGVARTLAHVLPYRERPLRTPAVHFQKPYGTDDQYLINWSAFPSDHAAIFFALAMAILFTWRAAGIVALCHVLVFICLPRIYLGFHYPTDILAGAAIGIAIASLSRFLVVREAVARFAVPWLKDSPATFYACLFILTFQIATIFESTRAIGHFFSYLLRVPA
jgi:undecaprenyl-diphosphatase